MTLIRISAATALCLTTAAAAYAQTDTLSGYGPRPAYLISQMMDGPLKDTLSACIGQTQSRTDFSIGHRGAPLQFPEHTVESNVAAAGMGAGILECDVTFTSDLALVCRHAQNDLHTTTDILLTDLAANCTAPFTAAAGETPATAECRTSDVTLAEFLTLQPKMDSFAATATTVEEFQGGVAPWRTSLYAGNATLMTHADSIALFGALGAGFTPELKAPAVEMPFNGFTQADYAQKLVDEYVAAGIDPSRVWLQSFDLDDVRYWIENTPDFGAQAVYLDDRYEAFDEDELQIDPLDPATFHPTMQELADMGLNYIAPPIPLLVTVDASGAIVPTPYAIAAKAAGLNIITWSLERSGPLVAGGGGFYFASVTDAITSDGTYYEVVDVLAQDVGVVGIFSDWPATVTFYANCMGL